MAGNPNPKGSKPDKLMRDAIMVALHREAKDAAGQPTRKLALMADALVDKALTGDVQAIREIGDRIDGKPVQAIETTGDFVPLYAARVPTGSKNMDEWQTTHANPLNNQTLQ